MAGGGGAASFRSYAGMVILHVEDDPTYAELVPRILQGVRHDIELRHVDTGAAAVRVARAVAPALVLLDHILPDGNGMDVLTALRAVCPSVPVVFLTVVGSPRLVVDALHAGATDFVLKDDELGRVLPRVVEDSLARATKAHAATGRAAIPRSDAGAPTSTDPLSTLIGASAGMEQVRALVRVAAATGAPVLIEGETGTGKELVARAVHALGRRRARPFVAINCAAIPEALAESEFFGHVRGAFTGAYREKEGLFEAARGGTLFLDEIEDLPCSLQAKMLRVLQDLEYRPVGSNGTRRADVRIIAASNQSASQLVRERRLRPDLYYRLCVLSVIVPPLRLRREDIPGLTAHFVRRFNDRNACEVGRLPPAFVNRLCCAPWPGNVRELENTLESLCVAAHGTSRSLEAIIVDLPRASISLTPIDERARILQALEVHRWSRQAAAQALGISRVTLWRRMSQLGIHDP